MTSLTLWVQQSGDAQVSLCHAEGLLQILLVALSVHLTHVNQSWPVFVYDGVEELSIPPAGGEIVTAQALVSLHHPLRPKQQLLFGRHVVRLAVHLNV